MITAFIVSVIGVNGFTQFYKKAVLRYGMNKIHIAVFVFSLAAALIVKMFGGTDTFKQIVEFTGAVFASAITLYEVVWKKFDDIGINESDLVS